MASARSSGQLALTLEHAERLGREDFLEGPSNAAALALVDRWPDWPDRIVMLVGPEGAGKSHLASIWAATAQARIVPAAALAESEIPRLVANSLVVEDLSPGGFDERLLFHLLNLAREERSFVLITARTAPSGWSIAVKDLASRLRALPVLTVAPPDDTLLRAVMVKLFADRQIGADESLVNYLATRIERSFAAARATIAALDGEALRQQRPITRALAADLFRAADQLELFASDKNTETL